MPCMLRGDALALLRDDDRPIVITGASGWFGRCLLEALDQALTAEAFARRVHACSNRGLPVRLRDGREIPTHPFTGLPGHCPPGAVLLHFAYLTKEQAVGSSLDSYIQANRAITDTVMATLRERQIQAVFMPSSGAVYRSAADEPQWSAANAYAKLKREDESRLGHWSDSDDNRRAVICRVFNVSGPYINKYGDYVLASAVDCAMRGQPIVIRTPRHTLRSFTAVDDLLSLALALLLDPQASRTPVFDTAGDPEIEIDELLAEVQATLGTDVRVERPPRIAEEDRYLGAAQPYLAMLDRYHVRPMPLREQILQTADYIRQFPGA